MADITKCMGKNCKIRGRCRRFLAPSDEKYQSWAAFDEMYQGFPCPFFFSLEEKEKKDVLSHHRKV